MGKRKNVAIRAMLHVAALDITLVVPMSFVMVDFMGLSDRMTFTGLVAVRGTLAMLHLHRLLSRARAWPRTELDDVRLLELVDELRELPQRYVPGFVLGWVAAIAGALLLGVLGVPAPTVVGSVELLAGVMLAMAMALAAPALLRPLLDNALLEAQAELGGLLVERHLSRKRGHRSISRGLALMIASMLGATYVGVGAITIEIRARGLRVAGQAELRGQTTTLAAELRGGMIEPTQLEPPFELVDEAELEGVLRGDGVTEHFDPREELALVAAPIGSGRWLVGRRTIEQDIGWVALISMLFIVSALAPGALASVALDRTLAKPLSELGNAARRMADVGDIHEFGRVVPLRDDEIGVLASNFNHMLDVFEQLSRAASEVAEGKLDVQLDGPGELQDAFRGMLERLRGMVSQLRGTALELASTATELQASAHQQNQAVMRQSDNVVGVSETVSTLARTSLDISDSAAEVLDNAERTRATTEIMLAKIDTLGVEAGRIQTLVDVIREIAERSDLLALNGSLEATRAGEAGRGFALVASEMRRLAERVTGTVADVRARIRDIEAASASTIAATHDSRALADDTATAAQRISTVTRKQSEESERVAGEIEAVANVMLSVADATRQTQAIAEGLRVQATEIERLTHQFQS